MEHDKDESLEKEISIDTIWHSIKSKCPACGLELLVSFCYGVEGIWIRPYFPILYPTSEEKEKDVQD